MFTFPNSPGYSCFAKLMSILFSLTLFLLEITFCNCTMSLFAQVGKYNGLTLLLDAETYDYWYQVMFSICFQTAMELFFLCSIVNSELLGMRKAIVIVASCYISTTATLNEIKCE